MYKCVNFFTFLQTKGKNIHRGALLAAAVDARNVTISKMVKRMGISRGTYYNHINDPHLPLEQLVAYGKAMGYDFSADLPMMRQLVLEEPEAVYKAPATLDEAIAQRDYWRELYYKTVQRLNEVLLKREMGSE